MSRSLPSYEHMVESMDIFGRHKLQEREDVFRIAKDLQNWLWQWNQDSDETVCVIISQPCVSISIGEACVWDSYESGEECSFSSCIDGYFRWLRAKLPASVVKKIEADLSKALSECESSRGES